MNNMEDISADLDDLGELFEFGDIDLNNIPNVESLQYDALNTLQNHSHQGTRSNTPFDAHTDAHSYGPVAAQAFSAHDQFGISHAVSQPQSFMGQHAGASTDNLYHGGAMAQAPLHQAFPAPHSQPFQFQQAPGFPPGHQIPPTPNSYEMHGETAHFMQQSGHLDQQQQALLDQRYGVRKDDATVYTPMVSPAVTPQFNVQPEFTIPGAYNFSPLTSPMLYAQNAQQNPQYQQHHHQHQTGYLTNPSTAPSSTHASPIDGSADVDMLGEALDQAQPQLRKSRRKNATPRSVGTGLNVRQSPMQKPQKRKSAMATSMQVDDDDHAAQPETSSAPASANLQLPPSIENSEADSVSPEALSESVMGPPPRPGPTFTRSPALVGRQQSAPGTGVGPAATPKSLLSGSRKQALPNGQATPSPVINQPTTQPESLEDLSLPEAARKQQSRHSSLISIDTNVQTSNDQTPRLAARKTPKLGPSSTPSSIRPQSATASPSLVGSPMSASTPSVLLRDAKDSGNRMRGSKKRSSMSAHGAKLVSPALVPKISPSIKPLLPEGTPLTSATQALLLASKSNYQNLLEGNHLPGVNYPESLSTGLTSKRTSHKVAEQGRRNRINDALKEMHALLPLTSPSISPMKPNSANKTSDEGDDDEGGNPNATGLDTNDSKEDSAAKSQNSKAATVEMANDYIRKMQRDHAAQSADLALLRKENDELRKKLAAQSGDEVVRETATSSEEGSSGADKAVEKTVDERGG